MKIKTKQIGQLSEAIAQLQKNWTHTSSAALNPPRRVPESKPRVHKLDLTPRIQLISANTQWQKKNQDNFELSGSKYEQSLVIFYSWLMAKDKYASKYVDFYTNLGFDVLKIKSEPKELLRPVKGTQITAQNVLDILHQNEVFSSILVKGMSVGCYAFGEAMVKLDDNYAQYRKILDRLTCQIYDSPVDVYKIPDGVAQTLTSNKLAQNYISSYIDWFMKVNYESATKHYIKSAKYIYDNYANVPGLFINSEADFLSTPKMMEPAYKGWDTVYTKNFKDTKHVAHIQKHKQEYQDEIISFLQRTHFLPELQRQAYA